MFTENEKWSSASIRIASRSTDADRISRLLDTEPSVSYKKGLPVNSRNPGGPLRQEHLWIMESGLDTSRSLDAHLAKLVTFIEQKTEDLKRLLPDCEIGLFCGFSSGNGQGGLVLNADLLKKITAIPIDIVLDLYPPLGEG